MQKSTYGEIATNIDLRNLFSIIIIKHYLNKSRLKHFDFYVFSSHNSHNQPARNNSKRFTRES